MHRHVPHPPTWPPASVGREPPPGKKLGLVTVRRYGRYRREPRVYIDRISELPDELIGYILSFVPIECAMSTSILSKRWRNLHTLSNCLNFDVPSNYIEVKKPSLRYLKRRRKKFMDFVNVLYSHESIKKFRLNCGDLVFSTAQLHDWVRYAVNKDAQEIDLTFSSPPSAFPNCLFLSRELVVLRITSRNGCAIPVKSVSLPNLRELQLSGVSFLDGGSVGGFVSGCLRLKELSIKQCNLPKQDCICSDTLERLVIRNSMGGVEIDAAKLTHLEYICEYAFDVNLSLKNSSPCALSTACLEFPFHSKIVFQTIQLALALINSCCYNAKELSLLGGCLEFIAYNKNECKPTCPNLVTLHLGDCSYKAWRHVTYLLAYSPNLEKVIFTQDVGVNEWVAIEALDPFSSPVKVIKVSQFSSHQSGLVILECLLKNCGELRELILYQDADMTIVQELWLSKELLKLQRASSSCAIQLIEADSQ